MHVVEVEALHKRYGDLVAIDEVSFAVDDGEIFGILGRNGAGKTTTVECIAGLRTPDAGEARLLGLDPVADRAQLRQVVGVQLQESKLQEDIQVEEAVRLYRSFYADGANVDRLLADLGLDDKRSTRFKDLSGGQKQRLSIALALVGQPRIAVLDELTTGLDPQARRDTWALIRQVRDSGVTILLVTHSMEEAERLCDRIAIIEQGRLAALDTPAGLAARVGGEQRVRLRTGEAVAPEVIDELEDLDDVATVEADGAELVVSGSQRALPAVLVALLDRGINVQETRTEQASLEDAFLAVTGRPLDASEGAR